MFIQIIKDYLFPIYLLIFEFLFILRLRKQLINPDPAGEFKEAKYLGTLSFMTWAIAGVSALAFFILDGAGGGSWVSNIFIVIFCLLMIGPAFIAPSILSGKTKLFKSEMILFVLYITQLMIFSTDYTATARMSSPLLHSVTRLLILCFSSLFTMGFAISYSQKLPNFNLDKKLKIFIGMELYPLIWLGIISYGLVFLIDLVLYLIFLSKIF